MIRALQAQPGEIIDIMAAGTAMRFLTAYFSVTPGTHILTGTERMKQRPIGILVNALRELGADIEYVGNEGFPPLRITGKTLRGHHITLPGNVSSQYISALLMIGPKLEYGLNITLTGEIVSLPYINMTLHLMADFGAKASWVNDHELKVEPQPYRSTPYYIENDWSAASYWYEMMALTNNPDDEIKLEGLMDGSKQGDSQVRYLFSLLGVKTTFKTKKAGVPTTVTLQHSGRCVPRLEYNFVNSPDLAQTFVVCCALLNVPFHFTGLSTLKIKETDRIEAMKTEMRKLGYVIRSVNDSELIWDGELCETTLEAGIDTYEDHRMALAFAPAAMRFEGLLINNPQVVTKSYPQFWEDIKAAGFEVKSEE